MKNVVINKVCETLLSLRFWCRYAMTDMRKLANRMQFGVTEESSLGDGIGEGFGMLGQAGSGKLRMAQGSSKLKVNTKK